MRGDPRATQDLLSYLFNPHQLLTEVIDASGDIVVVLLNAARDEIDHAEKQHHLSNGCHQPKRNDEQWRQEDAAQRLLSCPSFLIDRFLTLGITCGRATQPEKKRLRLTRLRTILTIDHIGSDGHGPPASRHATDNPHPRGLRLLISLDSADTADPPAADCPAAPDECGSDGAVRW